MDANCANLFTHQTFLFRNERQELVTAMVSIPCQLSASAQPHTGFSYINSNIGTPPALIPAYSYIPFQAMARQPSAAVRTNDNMIGDLFYLGSQQQSQDYQYQAMTNNGLHYAHPLQVTTSIHNSIAKVSRMDNGVSTTVQGPIASVAEPRIKTTSSLNSGHANGSISALGPINVDSKNVTVLQSGRVNQEPQVKYEEGGVIRNGSRKRRLSSARRRISSSSEEEDDGFVPESINSEKSDAISSSSSSRSSEEDSPISGGITEQLLHGDFGAYYNITCGDLIGQFYISRFARGSIGKCILYQGVWHTPTSFQSIAGRQGTKDWKKSIRCGKYSLKDMIKEGKFQEHPKSCTCGICFSVADAVAARDLSNNNSKVNQVILAKKRRLSQTDSGKSRKPTTQASMAVMPITVSDSRQEIIVNGNGIHTPTDVTVEDPSQTKDNVSNTKPPSVVSATDTNDAATSSPEESHQMVATCSDAVLESVLEGDAQFKVPGGSPFHTEAGTFIKNPRLWSCEEVSMFLKQSGFPQLQDHFMEQDVDGRSLLMLNEGHLMETFRMKLGSALKLLEAVGKLKHPPG